MLLKISKKIKKRLIECGYKDEEVDEIVNEHVTKEYQTTERKEENDDNQTLTVSFQYVNGYKSLQKCQERRCQK